jgi:hypothetical protein
MSAHALSAVLTSIDARQREASDVEYSGLMAHRTGSSGRVWGYWPHTRWYSTEYSTLATRALSRPPRDAEAGAAPYSTSVLGRSMEQLAKDEPCGRGRYMVLPADSLSQGGSDGLG